MTTAIARREGNVLTLRQSHPLTLEQIRRVAPSAFATEAYKDVTSKYTFIPTSDVIKGLMDSGLQPFQVTQSLTRIPGKQAYARHMIRFRQGHQRHQAVGESIPEVVLINGHDRSTSYQLLGGIFRLICSNGMVIADSMVGSIHVRHTGDVLQQVTDASLNLIERMPVVTAAIAAWQGIKLNNDQQLAFATAAHTVRFADAEGHTHTPIQPRQLLHPRRPEDVGNDLWSTFNRVQENVIRGGLAARPTGGGRRATTQEVKAIGRDVRLNQALWTLGEKMAELAK